MGRLRLEDSIQDTIFKYSGGNPGALTFLMKLIEVQEQNFFVDFMTIDNMELYEDKLYMLWNDSCNRDMNKVKKIFEYYRLGKITKKDIEERIKNVGYGKSFDDLLNDKTIKRCPKCNGPLGNRPALSRRDNKTDICADCGMKEAIKDVEKMVNMRKENNNGN